MSDGAIVPLRLAIVRSPMHQSSSVMSCGASNLFSVVNIDSRHVGIWTTQGTSSDSGGIESAQPLSASRRGKAKIPGGSVAGEIEVMLFDEEFLAL